MMNLKTLRRYIFGRWRLTLAVAIALFSISAVWISIRHNFQASGPVEFGVLVSISDNGPPIIDPIEPGESAEPYMQNVVLPGLADALNGKCVAQHVNLSQPALVVKCLGRSEAEAIGRWRLAVKPLLERHQRIFDIDAAAANLILAKYDEKLGRTLQRMQELKKLPIGSDLHGVVVRSRLEDLADQREALFAEREKILFRRQLNKMSIAGEVHVTDRTPGLRAWIFITILSVLGGVIVSLLVGLGTIVPDAERDCDAR